MPKNVVQKVVFSVMVGSTLAIWTLLSITYINNYCSQVQILFPSGSCKYLVYLCLVSSADLHVFLDPKAEHIKSIKCVTSHIVRSCNSNQPAQGLCFFQFFTWSLKEDSVLHAALITVS